MIQTDGPFAETYLDHLAIAVKDLDKALKIYEDIGLSFSPEREKVESQGVKTAFASLDHEQKAHLELLEPLNKESPIHKFIERKGEGLHHICFRVADVKKLSEELRSKGYNLLYPSPVPGARNCMVNFIHPKSANGVLIELLQDTERPI